ncbi:hypothetical protein OG21DRAFT_248418 [Imleria badia]|nr:hypothetical protein OG21DRAFT_248418 [Imleria badia]
MGISISGMYVSYTHVDLRLIVQLYSQRRYKKWPLRLLCCGFNLNRTVPRCTGCCCIELVQPFFSHRCDFILAIGHLPSHLGPLGTCSSHGSGHMPWRAER